MGVCISFSRVAVEPVRMYGNMDRFRYVDILNIHMDTTHLTKYGCSMVFSTK